MALEWAKKNEVVSNPFRALLLAVIVSRGKASWNEVKEVLEKVWGEFNPNTLVFHLNRLVDAGLVERIPAGNRHLYKPTEEGVRRTKTQARELLMKLGELNG